MAVLLDEVFIFPYNELVIPCVVQYVLMKAHCYAGIPYVVKKIRTGKYIKRLIAVVLILALISTVTYCIVLHEDHQITKRQEAVIAEDVIE